MTVCVLPLTTSRLGLSTVLLLAIGSCPVLIRYEYNKQIEDAKDVKQADPVNDPAVKEIIRRAIAEHVHIRRTPDISSADAIDQNDNEELEMI